MNNSGNRIFSFSLPPETTQIVDQFEKGRKSRIVSDAIWWFNYHSIDEIISNNMALQKIIQDLNQQLNQQRVDASD